jgi:hypothetical protein
MIKKAKETSAVIEPLIGPGEEIQTSGSCLPKA